MRRIGPRGLGNAALLLVQALNVVRQAELRPAVHDLGGVELLERDAAGPHALAVALEGNRAVRGPRSSPPVAE